MSKLDLNLFVVFQAVLETGSTVKAARQLAVTQSAVSNALARLRGTLGDPLFVRSGRGLVATPRALALQPAVKDALTGLERAVGNDFDPLTSTRTFTLAAADHHQVADVPKVAAAFSRALPRACLRVVSIDFLLSSNGLERGEVDVVLAPDGTAGPEHHARKLFHEAPGLYVRRGHRLAKQKGKASLAELQALGHIDVHVTLGRPGEVNKAVRGNLRALRFERRVEFIASSFTTAAMLAANTDAVAWLPSHAAEVFAARFGLVELNTGLAFPTAGISLLWHARTHVDPASRCFRELVVTALKR